MCLTFHSKNVSFKYIETCFGLFLGAWIMAFEHEGILIYKIVLHKMRCGLLVLSIRKTPIRSPYKRQARDTEYLFLLDQSQKAFQRWPNVERCRTSTLKWRWILIGFESWMDVETWRFSTEKFQMRRCFNVVIMTFASTLKLWRCFNVETLNNVDIWSADVFNQIQHNFNVGTTSYARAGMAFYIWPYTNSISIWQQLI